MKTLNIKVSKDPFFGYVITITKTSGIQKVYKNTKEEAEEYVKQLKEQEK